MLQKCVALISFNLHTQSPVVSLSLAAAFTRNLYEALIQAEVVTNRVLPAFLVLLKVRKSLGNVVVDFAERGSLVRCILTRWKRKFVKVESNVAKHQKPINLSVLSSPKSFSSLQIFRLGNKSSKNVNLLIAVIYQRFADRGKLKRHIRC